MAKLILYGDMRYLKTIVALYGKRLQKVELTDESYQTPVAPVEESLEEESEEITEDLVEAKPKKKKK